MNRNLFSILSFVLILIMWLNVVTADSLSVCEMISNDISDGKICNLYKGDVLKNSFGKGQYYISIDDVNSKGVDLRISNTFNSSVENFKNKSFDMFKGQTYDLNEFGFTLEVYIKDAFEDYMIFEIKETKEDVNSGEIVVIDKSKGTCLDNDGGKNYEQRGSTAIFYDIIESSEYGQPSTASSYFTYYDECLSNGEIYEYFCTKEGFIAREEYSCLNGCAYGFCISKEVKVLPENNITMDLADGDIDSGFLFGKVYGQKQIFSNPDNSYISNRQNQYRLLNVSVTSKRVEFNIGIIDIVGKEFYLDERYAIEKGKKILIDNPLIDFKEIKLSNIKLKEVREHVGYTPEEGDKFELIPKYVATLQFSEFETNGGELTKEPTRCTGTTCYLSIDDILIVIIDGEKYSFNIDAIFPEENGLDIIINKMSFDLIEGDFHNLNQFGLPIEISIKDTFENYIIFEVKEEFDSYKVTTPESFFAKIANFFRRLFGEG